MNIYLVSRTDDWGYDDYDEMVVIAGSAIQAKDLTMIEHSRKYSGWVKSKNLLEAKKIGTTDKDPQIVLESFNAG